jgi:hypothetical protein
MPKRNRLKNAILMAAMLSADSIIEGAFQISKLTTHAERSYGEERSDEAIQKGRGGTGWPCYARKDGLPYGFASR